MMLLEETKDFIIHLSGFFHSWSILHIINVLKSVSNRETEIKRDGAKKIKERFRTAID